MPACHGTPFLKSRVTPIDAPYRHLQLEAVVDVCRRSVSVADAGRKLFAATRTRRTSQNDSDRLRKYLARFQLDWAAVQEGRPVGPMTDGR